MDWSLAAVSGKHLRQDVLDSLCVKKPFENAHTLSGHRAAPELPVVDYKD